MQGDTLRWDRTNLITTLAELDDPDSSYSFHYFWIFQHKESDRIFYGEDSGCSCPSPFENDTWDGPDKNSFTEITAATFEQFRTALWDGYYKGDARLTDEKRAAEKAVRDALKM